MLDSAPPGPSESPPQRRQGSLARRLRWALRRIAVLVLGLLLPLLMLELGLRFFGAFIPGNYSTGKYLTAHPVYGRFHVPGFEGWLRTDEFVSHLRINREGLRGPEHRAIRPGDSYRILAIGDSFLEGAQVHERQTAASLLESQLAALIGKPTEVLNAGVGSWGTTQQQLFLEREGDRYQPDLVVVFFHPANDLWDNSFVLQRPQQPREPFYRLNRNGQLEAVPFQLARRPFRNELDLADMSAPGILRRTSWLYNAFETGVLDKMSDQSGGDPRLSTRAMVFWELRESEAVRETWDVTLALLLAMVKHCEDRAIEMIIAVVPPSSEVHDEDWLATQNRIRSAGLLARNYDRFQLARVIERRQQEVPVPWVDLGSPLRDAAATGERLYFSRDGHWTPAGHRIVAETLAKVIHRRQTP